MTAVQDMILIVDDQRDIRATVKRTLADEGRRFLEAGDGTEALQILEKQGGEIDAVVLDIMMPRTDGLETLASIRAREPIAHLPVVMLTALEDKEVEALALGATDYVRKPFDPVVLRLRVEQALTTAVAEQTLRAHGLSTADT